MGRLILGLAIALSGLAPRQVAGHEVRPAYLELRPSASATWDVLWKVPALGQLLRLRLHARLPDGCTELGPRRSDFVADAHVERWRVTCPGGLAGGTIRFEGLTALQTDVLLRIEGAGGRGDITARILPAGAQFTIPAEPSPIALMGTYLRLGVHHILLGADHLMFVLSLLLLVRGWRRLALAVTAFTVGHSLTLAAVTLGGLRLPGPPVEAAIALSIACAAAEALRARCGEPSLVSRAPWVMALGFGLLHGLGFADALREIGLPRHAVVPALLFFNLGVELGQLLFVTVVLTLGSLARSAADAGSGRGAAARFAARSQVVACYGVGIAGAYWLIERVHAMVF
jgi:hypothetical protein